MTEGNIPSNPQCRHGFDAKYLCLQCCKEEIERLTADQRDMVEQFGVLKAERDRLARELQEYGTRCAAYGREILGLRAALKRIAANPGHDLDDYFDEVSKTASEALAGGADTQSRISDENTASRIERDTDETSAMQGPGPCGFSNTYGRCILMRGHDGKHELQ